MKSLYYTPPSDASFEDMRVRALEIWHGYDNTYGYASEKMDRILGIENVGDNFMYIFAMFDMENQRKLVDRIHPLTRTDLRDRLVAGANDEVFISLLGL